VISFDPAKLEQLVVRSTGSAPTSIEDMTGGASTRRYLRLGGPFGALVAMFVPDAAPEEATSTTTVSTRWPFLEVHELLASSGVRVPKLVGEACDDGLLLLEDLGDVTLGAFIEENPWKRSEIYRVAVEDLASAQARLGDLPEGSIVGSRAFDRTLLRWELDHFREWALEARGRELANDDRVAFDAAAEALAIEIAGWPRGFTHRDYQSRNLMVVGSSDSTELAWIDFQDALLGPKVYDLVALLNDSYVDIDQAFIDARLDEYGKAAELDERGRETLGRSFDRLTVQRKMKDAGRFIFIDRQKNNPAFLPYFEPSLAKVRRSLARLEGDDVMKALARAVDRV
jgi:aminoglycoside/choline kinase family phosphotransferase